MSDIDLINEEIDKILVRLAEDEGISIIEFHLRYFAIEKSRRELNDAFDGVLRLIREVERGSSF